MGILTSEFDIPYEFMSLKDVEKSKLKVHEVVEVWRVGTMLHAS